MLDRDAGLLPARPDRRAACPAGRRYLPGHDGARDELGHARRLDHRARRAADRARGTTTTTARTRTAARRPTTTPTTCCCAPCAASTARCSSRSTASRRSTTAASARSWEYAGDGYHEAVARAEGSDLELRLTTDLNLGIEGPRVTARHLIKEGETCFCALSWSEHPAPRTLRRGLRAARLDRAPLAALARPRRVPRPPVARLPAAPRADAQGPDLRADRRDRRRRHHVAARDARRRAQLGLPLHLDPRLDVRALGPLHARLRLGGQRLLLLRRRRARRPSEGRLQIMYGIDGRAELPEQHARPPVRLRGRAAGAGRQRRLLAGPARRVGRGARLGLPAHEVARPRCPSASGRSSCSQVETALANWREPDRGIWEVRGEPQHFTSSKLMCWVALDRGARLAELREDWDRATRWRAVADEIHADICEHALDERGVFTQHYDTEALDASVLLMPLVRFLPADDQRIRATVLAIADELTEDGLVLRYRVEETDDGLARRGGHVHDLLVLARLRAVRDRRDRARAATLCEKLLSLREPARAVRRGDRPAHRPPPRQLPAGVHPPRADQRGDARDPRRGGRSRRASPRSRATRRRRPSRSRRRRSRSTSPHADA